MTQSNIIRAQLGLLATVQNHASFSTFDPANFTSGTFTFSNGNRTVTNATTSERAAVRSTSSRTSGKLYLEYTATFGPAASSGIACGLVNSSFPFNGSAYLGDIGGVSIGWQNGTGNIFAGGSTVGSSNSANDGFNTGDVLGMAVDLGGKKVWFKDITESSTWNDNGSADPVAGVDGIDVSFMSGALFAAVEAYIENGAWSINVGNASFAGSIPSGYSAWG